MKSQYLKAAVFISCLLFVIFTINFYRSQIDFKSFLSKQSSFIREQTTRSREINDIFKKRFKEIYEKKFWGDVGGGSGPGSTLAYTVITRDILYKVIKKYKINSILDAPCGAMVWMPELLKNLTVSNIFFKYHGIDIVESVITKSREKYANDFKNWNFSLFDLTRGPLPSDYDLIFSRDALQHLPLLAVYEALKSFATANNSRYLLVGSYLENKKNIQIKPGEYFDINLTLPPFNLDKYEEQYREAIFDYKLDKKFLILYDIPNYLSKIDFEKMKNDILSFI